MNFTIFYSFKENFSINLFLIEIKLIDVLYKRLHSILFPKNKSLKNLFQQFLKPQTKVVSQRVTMRMKEDKRVRPSNKIWWFTLLIRSEMLLFIFLFLSATHHAYSCLTQFLGPVSANIHNFQWNFCWVKRKNE